MKYDLIFIGYVNTFENLTKAGVKDCFFDKNNNLVFVVNNGDAGKAIGKFGSTIKRLNNLLKKNIKVIEYNEDVIQFIRNCLMPLKVQNITQENKLIKIESEDKKLKGLIFGRDRANLKELNEIVKRFFDVEVVVI
ncbi:MAG TPA: NusA-like transcription termination signal-binding factor [Candidatus Nanoarchaeia archaeon]|nr:NusA-like transcription termination signal-binding factor [Candidatus Nanoarchaeia archaeon]